MKDLDRLEPYGRNPKPSRVRSSRRESALHRQDEIKKHLDSARQGGTMIRCVAWNMADRMEELMSARRLLSGLHTEDQRMARE